MDNFEVGRFFVVSYKETGLPFIQKPIYFIQDTGTDRIMGKSFISYKKAKETCDWLNHATIMYDEEELISQNSSSKFDSWRD